MFSRGISCYFNTSFLDIPNTGNLNNLQLNYHLTPDVLADRALEVSVWNCGSLVGENSVIGSVVIPLRALSDVPMDRKGIKVLDGWFSLSASSR